MRIGVDTTAWQNNRGYGRHERALLRALLALDGENRYTFFMDSKELLDLVPPQAEVRMLPVSAATSSAASANGSRSIRDMWIASRAMSSPGLDALIFPTVYSFVPTFSRARKIVFLHDTIAETFPQLTHPHWKSRLFWQAKVKAGRSQADALVTVSEYSRRSIVERFALPRERVFVVGEAGDAAFRRIADPRLTPALEAAGLVPGRRMIVYVGGFSPHKNLESLVAAFAGIARRPAFDDAVLVLVGERRKEVFHSYVETVVTEVERLGIGSRVVFTGRLPDEDLAVLLNLAAVLALPSLMEGFGLPAVEAAACGCPVVATTESPLPALLAGGGYFVDPRGDGLGPALEALLGSESLRRSMGEAAAAAAARLTWDAAARQMLDVIHAVARV